MGLLIKLLALIGLAVMFAWTWLTGRVEVPVTGRTQVIAVSREEAAALGERAFADMLSRNRVVTAGAESEAVRAIAERIGGEADALIDPDYDWEVALLASPQANAFALPGGNIGVLTGLLDVARTPDQLAAIIAHEVAHVVARHGMERLTQQQLAELGQLAVGIAVGDMDPATRAAVLGALGLGAQYGILMPFSRRHEAEADHIGLILMARACYDPRAAIEMWRNMAAAAEGQPPEFLSTHPSHETRIEVISELMDEAMAARQEAGCPPLAA